jgi:hypothetical protein
MGRYVDVEVTDQLRGAVEMFYVFDCSDDTVWEVDVLVELILYCAGLVEGC